MVQQHVARADRDLVPAIGIVLGVIACISATNGRAASGGISIGFFEMDMSQMIAIRRYLCEPPPKIVPVCGWTLAPRPKASSSQTDRPRRRGYAEDRQYGLAGFLPGAGGEPRGIRLSERAPTFQARLFLVRGGIESILPSRSLRALIVWFWVWGMDAMPRLEPLKTCPRCGGRLCREPGLFGAVYVCERCDRSDPMEIAGPWINSELQPPEDVRQTDGRRGDHAR